MIEPISEEFQVLPVKRVLFCVSSIITWELIYQTFRRSYKLNITEASNITALIHAIHECLAVSFVFFIYYDDLLVIPPVNTWCDPIPKADIVLSITCGYFLWDLTWLARHFDKLWLLHAMMSLGVYLPAMFVPFMQRQSLFVLYYEISTIFYHLSLILEKYKYNQLSINVTKGLFAFSFFLCRIIGGSWIVFEVWDSSWFNILYKHQLGCVPLICYGPISILVFAFQCLNIYWFISILMQPFKSKKE